jgi:hypothetical protein
MSTTLPRPVAPVPLASRCPNCRRVLASSRICWNCCDQLCRVCGKWTGSAFVDICWPCWFRSQADAEMRGEK